MLQTGGTGSAQPIQAAGQFEEAAGLLGILGEQITHHCRFALLDAYPGRVTGMIRIHPVPIRNCLSVLIRAWRTPEHGPPCVLVQFLHVFSACHHRCGSVRVFVGRRLFSAGLHLQVVRVH